MLPFVTFMLSFGTLGSNPEMLRPVSEPLPRPDYILMVQERETRERAIAMRSPAAPKHAARRLVLSEMSREQQRELRQAAQRLMQENGGLVAGLR